MRNRSVALLLTFFVGYIGIHKFYLGQNTAGVLYLLFCWTMIPGILAFFEFIGLLLMSDQAFDVQYNNGYLPGGTAHIQASSSEKVATLKELKKLYDSGIITAEEYEEKRRKYLDSI